MSCFPSEPAIPRVSAWYAEGGDPVDGLTSLSRHIRRSSAKGVWIHLTDTDAVAERASFLRALAKDLPRQKLMRRFPLFGIPFAVKDNMDVKGLETTAACPAYAYTARSTAFAVQKLLDAGAVLMGKTNMDQFATGLVGTRSPYGPCPNAINSRYISGGSSSGSAHAVARGYVSFALGTDTAGSGRIPAALNNIVCLKPTPDSSPSGVSFPPVPRLTVLLFWPSAAGTASVFSEAWPGWMRTISGAGLRGLHRHSPADPLPWASRTDWNFLAIRPGKTRSAKPSHGSPLWGGRCAPWILPRMKKRHPCCILAPTWQSARLFSGIS